MILISLLIFSITLSIIIITYKYFFLSKSKNYILIKDYSSFAKFIPYLRKSEHIGVDTEHYHENTYKGILCLIQLYIEDFPYSIIIDLISLNDKKSDKERIFKILIEIFENKKIEKILHACHNDIQWIFETLGCEVNNIFDTQFMNKFIDKSNSNKNYSLNKLLSKYLNINFSDESKKFYQQSNWLKRPLSKDQLTYAANDALFLIKLRNKMSEIINSNDLDSIKNDVEINIKKKKNEKNDETNDNKYNNIATDFLNENMTILNENTYYEFTKELFTDLLKQTDQFASENNMNTDKLLSVHTIYQICIKLPKNKEKLIEIIEQGQNISLKNLTIDEKDNKNSKNAIEKKNLKLKKQLFYPNIIQFILNKTQNMNSIISKSNTINASFNPTKKSLMAIENKKALLLKDLKKQISRKTTINTFKCKHPVYESCKMLAPDGEQLCFCDNKKMTWYVSRNLAEIISEDPPIFRLYFEPNARGCVDENEKKSDFYISSRNNCCVICGDTKEYMRFHIIPTLYRSCFPENLKSHKSHDVVLLCFNCHELANKIYAKKKEEISKKYDVPLNVQSDNKKIYDNLKSFKKKCTIIMKKGNKEIPEFAKNKLKKSLIRDLEKLVKVSNELKTFIEDNNLKYNDVEDINDNFFDLMINKFKIELKNDGDKKNIHGQLVMDKIKDIKEFIKDWRTYFIDNLKPKFLPKEWSIDHEMVRTFGECSNFKNDQEIVERKTK